jgi:hypothetical protein
MITDADIDFHLPANADYRHAETNFWTVLIPEERLMAVVYTVARKALGVQSCDISIYGALTPHRVETLYLDSQQHLPCPESLRAYRTVNGLSVSAKSIRDYRIDYIGYDDTELHFDFRGLMAPFDIHDPNDSPLAKPTTAEQHTNSGLGSGYGGHFDTTGHLTGTLRLRGSDFPIDCYETMDHSWGVRPEVHLPSMGVQQAQFGPELGFKWINHWDMDAPADRATRLAHGYVLDEGKSYGLVDAKLITQRVGNMITGMQATVTDKRGRSYTMTGQAEIGGPWHCYTGSTLFMAMMRWTLSDGRVGHGLASEISSLQSLTRKYGRRWRDPSPYLTS